MHIQEVVPPWLRNPPLHTQPVGLSIHVMFDQKYKLWYTIKEREYFPMGSFITKTEAMSHGIQQAREGLGMLTIHGMNGSIQSVWDYSDWSDPFT